MAYHARYLTYDGSQFKRYLGLPLIREDKQAKSKDYMADDDDEDSDDGLDVNMAPVAPGPPSSQLVEIDLADPQTELFLDDPEKSMKIFFSSHFRTHGNI